MFPVQVIGTSTPETVSYFVNMNNEQEGKKRVEFTPPDGFSAPEHEGEEFDLICTFKVKPDGQICMTKLGDTEMPGYGDKDDQKKDDKPSYAGMANTLMSQDVGPGAAAAGY